MSTTPTLRDAAQALKPCPWCGAGETMLHVNKGTWNGQRYGEPVSVEVRHWCEPEAGQPARMVVRVGRDEESAIAAWNRRTALTQGAGEAVEWEDWTPEVESRFRELSDEAEVWLALRSDPSFPARAYWDTTDNRFHNLDDGYLERSANITHVMPRRHPDTPMRIAAIRAKGTHQ